MKKRKGVEYNEYFLNAEGSVRSSNHGVSLEHIEDNLEFWENGIGILGLQNSE